ncbi:BtpA/SgcQ family protein [Candidatus Bipolaricaulota bacterium]|nr:BtpA/SgcQ family protein [Candidatus Bipolaricaulota bacterium]
MKPFSCEKPLIGMIHLPALPGSYGYGGEDLDKILEEACRDLDTLQSGGVDGAIVENFGDAPFAKYAPKETVAAMTVIVNGIVRAARVPVGVNVLRNDGVAAISIAAATGAAFVRVNVFCGVALTDQGMIEGNARELLDLRKRLKCDVKILADVHVKHAAHLTTIEEAALDADRNRPDGLIVSGIGTGKRTPPENLTKVKQMTDLPVFIGSGVRIDNLSTYHAADGFIVGTILKEGGKIYAPIIADQVRAMAGAVTELRREE